MLLIRFEWNCQLTQVELVSFWWIFFVENESLAKQSELKKIKIQLEERDNDINSLSYDKDGLRQQLKDTSSQMDTLKGKKNIFCQVVTFSIVSLPTHL